MIPKFYVYTIDTVLDEEGDSKKFTVPSLSRDINDEFDLDCIANSAALTFFLNNKEYQEVESWPLTFKFLSYDKSIREASVTLAFSPSFSTNIPKFKEPVVTKRVRRTKKQIEESLNNGSNTA